MGYSFTVPTKVYIVDTQTNKPIASFGCAPKNGFRIERTNEGVFSVFYNGSPCKIAYCPSPLPNYSLLDSENIDAVFDDEPLTTYVIELSRMKGDYNTEEGIVALYFDPKSHRPNRSPTNTRRERVVYEGESNENWGSW